MGELSKRVIALVENKHLDPGLSEVASFITPLLNLAEEEVNDSGMELNELIEIYDKRETNLTQRKTEHGGFKESIISLCRAHAPIDAIAIKSGFYFVQIIIDIEFEKIAGIIYVKQETLDFHVKEPG